MEKLKSTIVLLVLTGLAATVYAEEEAERRQGADLSTTVGLKLQHDSNLYLQDEDETDALAFILEPGGDLSYAWGTSELYLKYRGELGEYDTTSKDDYFDNYLGAGYDIDLTSRHHVKGEGYFYRNHIPFGVDRTESTPREDRDLDEYEVKGVQGEYMFGADEAKINMGVFGEYYDLEFKTNRDETFFLDRQAAILGARAVYNFSRRTMFLLDFENRDIQFDDATPGFTKRDATEQRILAGVRWAATGKTFGTVRVGHISRDHDAGERDDFSGIDWDVAVGWSPSRRDTFTLRSQRTTRESYLEEADFINTESLGLTWDHQWNQRFSTEVGYAIFQADFDGQNWPGLNEIRKDDLSRFELGGTYQLNRHLSLEFGYEYRERDSNVDRDLSAGIPRSLDYDRNLFTVGLIARY